MTSNSPTLLDFFKGNNKQKIIVYFQKEDVITNGEVRDSENEPELILTTGEDMRIKNKAVYFVRLIPNGVSVTGVPGGNEIIFGEINKDTMFCLENILNNCFYKHIDKLQEDDWDKCDDEQIKEYKHTMTRFTKELEEAMKSLQGVIYLSKPKPDWNLHKIQETDTNALVKLSQNNAFLHEISQLYNEWMVQIQDVIDEQPEKNTEDSGPRSELD